MYAYITTGSSESDPLEVSYHIAEYHAFGLSDRAKKVQSVIYLVRT